MDKHFILDTDASGFAVGAVLSQIHGDREHVVAYFSRALSKPERQYCVTRRELLAIIEAVKHFHHYLYGVHFTVRIDHGALGWLMRFKNPEGQIARWLEVLSTYDFQIQHRSGKQHGNADGLSRRPCTTCSHCDRQEQKESNSSVNDAEQSTECHLRLTASDDKQEDTETEDYEINANWWQGKTTSELQEAQRADPVLLVIHDMKRSNEERPKWEQLSHHNTTVKAYWAQWSVIEMCDGVLYRKIRDEATKKTKWQLIVPVSLREEILKMVHDNPSAGHLGITRTIARVQNRFYWVGYTQYIENWCRRCDVCQMLDISAKL